MIKLKSYRTIFGIRFSKKHRLPSSWAEVSRRQAIVFARCLIAADQPFPRWAPGKESAELVEGYTEAFKFWIIRMFSNMPGRDFYRISDVGITLLIQKMQEIWQGDSSYPALKYIRIYFRKYYLPSWCMENSEFLDLALAEEYYLKIINGEDVEKNMRMLAGVLCRPLGFPWLRALTNQQLKPNQEHTAKKLKYKKKNRLWADVCESFIKPAHPEIFYVYFYYYSVRQQLRQMYPEVYKERGPRAGTGGPDFTSKYNLLGVIHSLAGSGPFGTWKQTAGENCHTVLHYLNYNADKMKEMELKQKMQKVS